MSGFENNASDSQNTIKNEETTVASKERRNEEVLPESNENGCLKASDSGKLRRATTAGQNEHAMHKSVKDMLPSQTSDVEKVTTGRKASENVEADTSSDDLLSVTTTSPAAILPATLLVAATLSTAISSATTLATTPPSPTSANTSGPQLPHAVSDPTFGIQLLRCSQQQQAKIKTYHETKQQTAVWSTDVTPKAASTSGVAFKLESVSASATPSMVRKSSDASLALPRRVSFPKSDNELVTGYCEPANPWEHARSVSSVSEIAELYVISCQKHKTKPLQLILDHLKAVELNKQLRQPVLCLKSTKLEARDCEALEEIFKRVQYKSIDLSSCELDECAACALFEIFEYYEATNELDISSNAKGMTRRGWISCTYMLKHSQELQVLVAQGNPISEYSAGCLGDSLSTSNLQTLKLEHCGLKGSPLNALCFKLRQNKVLKELWLAYNDLDCHDAETIADLLKVNHYIELVDISNNNIRDVGLRHIVEALILQSSEIERRSTMQRATAIDDDDSFSVPTTDLDQATSPSTISCKGNKCDIAESHATDNSNESTKKLIDIQENAVSAESSTVTTTVTTPLTPLTTLPSMTTSPCTGAVEENDADDDTEDTVKTSYNAHKITSQAATGQSMLDKLLSMNSDSSSEDGASNLSTDTIAACCSEDTSIISDDIFEGTATGTTNTCTNTKAASASSASPTFISATGVIITSSMMAMGNEAITQKDQEAHLLQLENENLLIDLISLTGMTSGDSSTDTDCNTNNNRNNNNENVSSLQLNHDYASLNSPLRQTAVLSDESALASGGIFEVTAEESDCLISAATCGEHGSEDQTLLMQKSTKALDVNKNTKFGEDYDDTHSTDSAFESASEGDISRHLPEEFSRLSSSLESTRLDDMTKVGITIETATIATESTECLAEATPTPSSTPTPPTPPFARYSTAPIDDGTSCNLPAAPVTESHQNVTTVNCTELQENPSAPSMPKVTIFEGSMPSKEKETTTTSPSPTPPPPSTSPGGASVGLRRTETSCSFITSSARNRSQSSDSLCSDNSLDGSVGSDLNFSASSLTKNDTLTRQQRQFEQPVDNTTKAPNGLKALALWNNNLTKEAGHFISDLLVETISLELLNIGKNCLSNDFVVRIKESLTKNTTLTTLGLQSAHLSAHGIETLASILTFGGNSTLQRIDIRDNKLEVESLTTIAEVLKSNTTIAQIDIDDEPKRLSFEKLRIVPFVSITPPSPTPQENIGSDAHLDYTRELENVRSMCSRNEKTHSQLQADKSVSAAGVGRRRGGYYLGSRKISLTCHSRPLIDTISISSTASGLTPVAKLDVKRKSGVRLRSPVPSPPTISPSSSPSRSRFHVSRVPEISPLTSPMAQIPPFSGTPTVADNVSSSIAIPATSANVVLMSVQQKKLVSTTFHTSSSLPSMATVTSSTQSIKKLSISPRSRFHVSKIYEDPRVPLTDRSLPPITPPLHLPPTPLSKTAPMASTTLESNTTADHKPSPKSVGSAVEGDSISSNTFNYTNNQNSTNATNLSPLCASVCSLSSSSSTSPASMSSSSSTSPASMTSSSSSSSSASYMSSSSSSSTAPAKNCGNTDSGTETMDTAKVVPTPLARCPLATFNDNDITLTKNSAVNEMFCGAVIATVAPNPADSHSKADSGITDDTVAVNAQTEHQRARKVSWIANPAAVDKLRALFQKPATIFQRSSSPESSMVSATTAPAQAAHHADCTPNNTPSSQLQQQNSSLVSMRKQSPPIWTALGADILSAGAAEASRQIRDFGKQVFRQNISFGNEANSGNAIGGAAATANAADCAGVGGDGVLLLAGSGAVGGATPPQLPQEHHDAAFIPTDVKQEIKENISPEHTVNEETLHRLQKLCVGVPSDGSSSSSSGSDSAAVSDERTGSQVPPSTEELAASAAVSTAKDSSLSAADAI